MTYARPLVDRPLRSLVVTRTLPGPMGGGNDLRRLAIARSLAALGPVIVFGLGRGGAAPPSDAGRDRLGWRWSSDLEAARAPRGSELPTALAEGQSPFAPRPSGVATAELLEVATEFEPDLVVIGGLDLAHYAAALRPRTAQLVVDLDYAQARATVELARADRNPRRALLWRHAASLVARQEVELVHAVDQVWISDHTDVEHLTVLAGPSVHVAVIPNTVDPLSYPTAARDDPSTLVFPARFDFWPNEDAARHLVDEILPLLPDARLCLVGRDPPPWLVARGGARVTVTGPVPDVRPHLAAAAAMPIPLRAGAGTRLKALEAFATGLPVVSTAKGVEGLGVVDGIHYIRAESTDEFVAALDVVRSDTPVARRCIAEARALVEREFSSMALDRAITKALTATTLVSGD
ncbi:MAG: glycosyltransferase [Acidimicrobiia bacterium]|nr:glycosyltransferase [Acidimicrobiia bacterium]